MSVLGVDNIIWTKLSHVGQGGHESIVYMLIWGSLHKLLNLGTLCRPLSTHCHKTMAVFLADDKLPELRDRLQHKPRYLKIYNEVITKLDSVVTGFHFIVDKWPDFKAVITKPDPETVEFEFLNNIYNVAAEDETALSDLLEQQGVIDWNKGIVFACVDSTFSKVINEAIKCHGGSSDPSEPCYVQCVTQESLNVKPVPDGFKLLPLTQGDSKFVNSQWKFTVEMNLLHTLTSSLRVYLPAVCMTKMAPLLDLQCPIIMGPSECYMWWRSIGGRDTPRSSCHIWHRRDFRLARKHLL
ncbi:glycine N-acyltransferase-like protein Keg1 [Haliotis rubra]|uniref:glycine N-acyltransferase-like protein Keg1 n=1 Tax=Haliotis rubra TaxID=36100 RepID=UPI001EE62CDA|nr:glycine N-acyltransferase-like protein Keg1 [Haliotis rubra]